MVGAVCVLPSALVTALQDAIGRAQRHLLSIQAPDGHWVGELEADRALTAEYLLFCHLIDRVNRDQEQKAARYLPRRQNPDDGWSLFDGGPSDLSATIKIYFALKMAGTPVGDPVMVAARNRVLEMGGPTKANVFTKIQLACSASTTGTACRRCRPRSCCCPAVLPLQHLRGLVLVALRDRAAAHHHGPQADQVAAVLAVPRRAVAGAPRAAGLRFPRVPEPFSWRSLFWKSVFIGVDDGLKIWERFSPRPLRKRAIDAARLWLEERLAVPGGWAASTRPWPTPCWPCACSAIPRTIR